MVRPGRMVAPMPICASTPMRTWPAPCFRRVVVAKAGYAERLPGISQLQDHVGDGLGMDAAAEDAHTVSGYLP